MRAGRQRRVGDSRPVSRLITTLSLAKMSPFDQLSIPFPGCRFHRPEVIWYDTPPLRGVGARTAQF